LREKGISFVIIDCDGDIAQLVPLWLSGGVNCMFLQGIGAWGAGPVNYRDEYDKNLLTIGDLSKLILAESPQAVTRGVKPLTSLAEEGGYSPTPNHRVSPSVSYAKYPHHIPETRHVWEKTGQK
jgi:uroporphyrinogen decarboxylase